MRMMARMQKNGDNPKVLVIMLLIKSQHSLTLLRRSFPLGNMAGRPFSSPLPDGLITMAKRRGCWSPLRPSLRRYVYLVLCKFFQLWYIVFKLVKTKKPTGDAYCPPDIKCAHKIEALINKCACTHDLNDSDFKDDIEGNSDCSGNAEALVQPKKSDIKKDVCTAIIWRPDPNVQRHSCSNNTDLIGRLADAFNPHALQAHEDDRSYCSLQNSQIFTLTQQLHDANNIMESLRSQVNALQSHLHKADHAHDPLKIEQKMLANMEQHSQCWTCPKHCIWHSKSMYKAIASAG